MKPESRLIAAVNRLLPIKKLKSSAAARERYPAFAHLHFEKMHNIYRGGTADAWYSGHGNDLWLEYKHLAHLSGQTICPLDLLSALQADWLAERDSEGRNVGVLIGCGQGRETRAIMLFHKNWKKEFPMDEFIRRLRTLPETAQQIVNYTKEDPCSVY